MEVFVFPKKSCQKSTQSYNDNLLPHPEYFPKSSIQSKFVGDKCLEKKLQQKSDEKYFGYKCQNIDGFVGIHTILTNK